MDYYYISGNPTQIENWNPIPDNFEGVEDRFFITSDVDLSDNWTIEGELIIDANKVFNQLDGILDIDKLTIEGKYFNNSGHHSNNFKLLTINENGLMHTYFRNTVAFFVINGAGIYKHEAVGSTANGVLNDFPGSSSKTISPTSTIELLKWADGGSSPRINYFKSGNLILNISNLASALIFGTIDADGDFILQNLSTKFTYASIFNIKGNFIINSGCIVRLANGGQSVSTINIEGNIEVNDNSNFGRYNGTVNLNFIGTSEQIFYTSSSAFTTSLLSGGVNYLVNHKLTLDINHVNKISISSGRLFNLNGILDFKNPNFLIDGSGTFNLNSGGTLNIYNPLGIINSSATGQIRTTTRNFSTSANYVYKGTTNGQIFGNGLPTTVNNLTLANTGGAIFSESINRLINGNLTLNNNYKILPGIQLTVTGNINLNLPQALILDSSGIEDSQNAILLSKGAIYYTNNGSVLVKKFLTGHSNAQGKPDEKGWYVSVPVNNQTAEKFNVESDNELYFFSETNNQWERIEEQETPLTPLTKGYAVRLKNNTTLNLEGQLFTGNIQIPLTNLNKGFNLISNPYPCSIDWAAQSGWSRQNIDPLIWIPDGNTPLKFRKFNYRTNQGDGRYIKAGESFWVKLLNTPEGSITMNDNVKTLSD